MSTQLADDYPRYARLRRSHPHRPAAQVLGYMRYEEQGGFETLEQFYCMHSFAYTDDDEAHGRSYCQYCGLDGDG